MGGNDFVAMVVCEQNDQQSLREREKRERKRKTSLSQAGLLQQGTHHQSGDDTKC